MPNSESHVDLNTSQDYIIKLPPGGRTGALWLDGGHNVVLIGGQITIPTTANQTDNGVDNTDTGIYIKGATGTVHVEGVLITGEPDVMFDGIDVNAPLATIQLENILIENVWGSFTTEHADAVQTWGGFNALRIDNLTANGDYQGLTIDPDLGTEGPVDIRNVDLTVDPAPAVLAPDTVGGGHMIWLTSGSTTCNAAASVSLSNVYVQDDKSGLPATNTVWPQAADTTLSCAGSLKGDVVTWPGLPVAGGVTLGSPPGGPFVPVGVAGLNYESPGYAPEGADSPPRNQDPRQAVHATRHKRTRRKHATRHKRTRRKHATRHKRTRRKALHATRHKRTRRTSRH